MKKSIPYLLLTFQFVFILNARGQNQNISNYNFGDTEPFLAVNPANQNNIIAAWIKATGFLQASIAVSRSTDAGLTWSAPVNMGHIVSTWTSADPSIDFNSSGKAFLSYVDYKMTHDSGYVAVVSSTNEGLSWSAPVGAISGTKTTDKPVDRPWIAIDRSGNTFDGRIYISSINVEDSGTVNHVFMKYSDDDALTWSSLDTLDDSIPADLARTMGAIAVGADGDVYVAYLSWHIPLSFFLRLVCIKSTDGGISFTPYVMGNAVSGSGINDTLQFSSTLSSNPTNADNLIFTFTDGRNGDADILAIRSTDGGLTWSNPPVNVNDDSGVGTNEQDMSWAGFSPSGRFVSAWRDRRNSGSSVLSPFEIWASVSGDGGASFGLNFRISDTLSPDIPVQKGNDFIGVAVSDDFVFNDWCDFRTGNYEIFFNRDSLSSPQSLQVSLKDDFGIQCFPNPFTEEINFSFRNHRTEMVKVWITDFSGKEIATLKNSKMNKGDFTLQFDGSKLPAGKYLIRVESGNLSGAKVFVKE